jgi:hypothetical protein
MMRCWDTMKVLRYRETGFEVCEDGVGVVLHGTCSTAGCIMTLLSTTLAGGMLAFQDSAYAYGQIGVCWRLGVLYECIVRNEISFCKINEAVAKLCGETLFSRK